MAKFKVSNRFMEGPAFQLMIDRYGPFIDISKSEESWNEFLNYRILKFDIPGTEHDSYYDLWFKTNPDGSVEIDRLEKEPTHDEIQAEKIESINFDIQIANNKGFATGSISDGYHSFDELYAHQIALFKALCIQLMNGSSLINVWKSKLHSDGSHLEGRFVSGIGVDAGKQITYHVPLSEWDTWPGDEMNTAPKWDGHTSTDVLKRLAKL